MTAPTSTGTRLSKNERREQLLDAAADLVINQGAGALTMEGLAAGAGVSKALPYSHFGNADDVLAELWQREIEQLGTGVLAAVRGLERGESSLRAAICTYFDFVARRGAILAVVDGATRAGEEPDLKLGPDFVGQLLRKNFDVGRAESVRLGELILATLNGATMMWARGAAKRRVVEETAVEFILAGVRAAANRG